MYGKFITFEGGEGSGKSTQVQMLSNYLDSKGYPVISTKEPGGTPLGQEIRKMLVCGDTNKMDAITETLLYFADRHTHLEQKIWPALQSGKIVISDRFADSTVAYQCYGYQKKISQNTINEIYKIAVGDFKPDLTIILDIEPQKGLKRSFAKAQTQEVKELRFESQDLIFHQNLRQGFLDIAKNDPQRCVILNADQPQETLHQEIIKVVNTRLGI